MYIKKKFEAKKNEDEKDPAVELFDDRKDEALESIGHLADIVDSIAPTDKDSEQAKLALIAYIKAGVDNLVGAVEEKMGLKKNA